MDPRVLLYAGGKPYIETGGLVVTEDGAWPFASPTGFSTVIQRGSAIEKVSDTSLAVSPTVAIGVGRIVLFYAVTDNANVSTGATTEHSVADTDGHTWTKVFERTFNPGPAALTGVTHSLWWTLTTAQIGTGDSVTLTLATAVTAKAIRLFEVPITPGNSISLVASDFDEAALDASNLSVSGLASQQYLFLHLRGMETNSATWTPDADYTELLPEVRTTGGSQSDNVTSQVNYRVAVLTGDTNTASHGATRDSVDALVVFAELIAGGIEVPHIGPVGVVYAPIVQGPIILAHIGPVGVVNAPTIRSQIALNHIGPVAVVNAPTVMPLIGLSHIGPVGVLNAPTLIRTLSVPHIGPTSVVYAPLVGDFIDIGHIGPTSVLFAPTFNIFIVIPHLGPVAELFGPVIHGIELPHIGPVGVLYDPMVASPIILSHIGPVSVVNAPSIFGGRIFLSHIGPVGVVHEPSMGGAAATDIRVARQASVVAISNASEDRDAQVARQAVVVAHHFPEDDTEARVARPAIVVAISRPHGWDWFDDPALPFIGQLGGGGGSPSTGDETPPDPPTNLVATKGDTTVQLGWADNDESDLDRYIIYQATASGGPYAQVGISTVSEFVVSGLTNGTTYFFVVTAVDDFGHESLESNEASATPAAAPGGDVTPPAVPNAPSVVPGDRQVALNWNDSPDSDFNHFRIYRATAVGGPYTQVATRTISDYVDVGLTNGTTYFYKVSAVDQTGNESAQSAASAPARPESGVVDTTPPPAPTSLSALPGDRVAILDWPDNPAPDLREYRIYRSLSATGSFSFIATRTLSNHTDGGLTNGTTYYYRVTAVDTSGLESPPSPVANATPVAPPPIPGGGGGDDGFPQYSDRSITINVGEDWDTRINTVSAGTVIGIAPGNHPIFTSGAQFSPRNGERLVGVIDSLGNPMSWVRGNWDQTQFGGGLVSPFPFPNTESYTSNVQLLRLGFELFASTFGQGAINGGDNWRFHKCHIRKNKSAAVRLGNGAILFQSKVYHNGQIGIKQRTGSTGATVDGCEVYENNYALWHSEFGEAGGQKFIGQDPTNMIVRRSHYHHNNGSGIWYDQTGAGGIIEDNLCEFNTKVGLHYEICSGQAFIRRNTCRFNGGAANLYISNSRGVSGSPIIVEDNLVYDSTGNAEIWLKDDPARSPRLGYVTVRRNRIYRAITNTAAVNVVCGEFGNSVTTPPGIVINENQYFTNFTNAWQWMDVKRTWTQWRALGFDTIGSLSPYRAPA